MDGNFNRLAEAGLAVAAAEERAAEGAYQGAREALDETDAHLGALRDAWPGMTSGERRVVGATARGVRERRDAVAARLPRHATLAAIPEEADPEQEAEPDGVAA